MIVVLIPIWGDKYNLLLNRDKVTNDKKRTKRGLWYKFLYKTKRCILQALF
jgi:hypothetical protein